MKKSELLRAVERRLFWERVQDFVQAKKGTVRCWQNRATARKLERAGMLFELED